MEVILMGIQNQSFAPISTTFWPGNWTLPWVVKPLLLFYLIFEAKSVHVCDHGDDGDGVLSELQQSLLLPHPSAVLGWAQLTFKVKSRSWRRCDC